ncbi:hypothetical protein GIB67_011747 [Kingdonia uniflora]|uniref:Uncharacterized protein n=1 Tax=Kingdonia uniflora TaxID=39325 RepID=A0A7J7LUH1_9MAGN|nr:hypothetical protein GIB67_011747 [Kingdonia uniflora]
MFSSERSPCSTPDHIIHHTWGGIIPQNTTIPPFHNLQFIPNFLPLHSMNHINCASKPT